MPYTIIIHDSNNEGRQLYSQTVDRMDLKAVIDAVNQPPPPEAPKKKRRSDAGKPRAPRTVAEALAQQKTGGVA